MNNKTSVAFPVTKELNRFLVQVRCTIARSCGLSSLNNGFYVENSGSHALMVMRIKELIYMFERRAARTEIRRFQLSFYMTLQTECPDSEQNKRIDKITPNVSFGEILPNLFRHSTFPLIYN